MKSRLIVLALAIHAGTALAQYKCTAADGAVTFQQAPCVGAKSADRLVVIPNGHPPPASGADAAAPVPPRRTTSPPAAASQSVDQRMLASYRNDHLRDGLVVHLRQAQDDAAARRNRHDAEVAAARAQFPNEADSQRLADALAAIESRYRAMSVIDDNRIRTAQEAIDSWDRARLDAARGK
jgi:hypothetical protein